MDLEDLARRIGARVLVRGTPERARADRFYAGDRISDLLNHASDRTLLVTNLASLQLVRSADLMDVPGVCVAGAAPPDAGTLAAAEAHGLFLLLSPYDLFETCGRLYACRDGEPRTGP